MSRSAYNEILKRSMKDAYGKGTAANYQLLFPTIFPHIRFASNICCGSRKRRKAYCGI